MLEAILLDYIALDLSILNLSFNPSSRPPSYERKPSIQEDGQSDGWDF